MKDIICERCGSRSDLSDNFCRRCGASLHVEATNLPVLVDADATDAHVPVPWHAAMPVIARGVTVLVAGTLLEMAARWLTQRALSRVAGSSSRQDRSGNRRAIRLRPVDRGERPAAEDTAVYSETYTYRRVIIRK